MLKIIFKEVFGLNCKQANKELINVEFVHL